MIIKTVTYMIDAHDDDVYPGPFAGDAYRVKDGSFILVHAVDNDRVHHMVWFKTDIQVMSCTHFSELIKDGFFKLVYRLPVYDLPCHDLGKPICESNNIKGDSDDK